MGKAKRDIAVLGEKQLDESQIFERVANIIETRKSRAGAFANCEVTLMYWEVGQYVGSVLLGGERAEYGKRIVAALAQQLTERYGNSFERTKITRMIKFTVAPISHIPSESRLSNNHFTTNPSFFGALS